VRLFSVGAPNRQCPGTHASAEGETMHAALAKVGVPASFIRIEGAGHGFSGAHLERANAAMVQWFERHLGSAAK
jgi:dipeptidyl aminopeptidase/acylaminoacyl peptidase